VETRRRLRQLKAEGFTQAEIARRLGRKCRLRPLPAMIEVRTMLKIRRLVRLVLAERPDSAY
jgi:hypothetical protein